MRKSLIFAVFLCICLGIGLVYSGIVVDRQKEAVGIEHELLEGDVSAAEGISLHIRNQWTGRLFWDTQIKYGKDGAITSETDFECDWAIEGKSRYLAHFGFGGAEEGVSIWYDEGYRHFSGMHLNPSDREAFLAMHAEMSFKEAVIEVMERAPGGGTYQETVKLSDYVEVYPLTLDITGAGNLDWNYFEYDFLGNYFGIKIPEQELLQVTVAKTDNGEVTELVMENLHASRFECCSANTEEGVYFGFYMVGENGEVILPERNSENGIYFIPLADNEEDAEWREVCYQEIETVYILSEDSLPVEMSVDANGDLVLLTKEKEQLVLRKIDRHTMQELQYLELFPMSAEDRFGRIDFESEGVFVTLESGDFAFLTMDKGLYEKQITGSLGSVSGLSDLYHDWAYALDYKNGRLAVIGAESYYRCGAYVYVFDVDGLQYKGRITCMSDKEDHYDYRGIFLQEENAYDISFAE